MTSQNDSIFHSDVTGKLIIKARLGDDIRCMPIHNADLNYDELVLMMLRVFKGQLSEKDEITIKYKDEDGDLVTMANDSDLSFAIECSKFLKITIFVNSKMKPSLEDDIKELKKFLPSLIEVTNRLLGSVEVNRNAKGPSPMPDSAGAQKPSELEVGDQKTGGVFPTKNEGKEFDPLLRDSQPSGPQDPSRQSGFSQPHFPESRSQTPSSSNSNAPQNPTQFQPNQPPFSSSSAPVPSPPQPPYSSNPAANHPQAPQMPPFDHQQNTGGGYPSQSQYNGANRIGGPSGYPSTPSSSVSGGSAPPGASFRPPTGQTSYPPGNYSVAGYPNQPVQTGLPGGQQGYQGYPSYGPPQGMGGHPQSQSSGTSGYMNQRPPPSGDIRAQNYSPAPPPPSQGMSNPYSRGPAQGYPYPQGQYPSTQ